MCQFFTLMKSAVFGAQKLQNCGFQCSLNPPVENSWPGTQGKATTSDKENTWANLCSLCICKYLGQGPIPALVPGDLLGMLNF